MSRRPGKIFFAGIVSALFVASADAADYAAGFSVGAGISHNDNIRFASTDKIAVRKIDVSPVLTFGINTETSNAQLDATFIFNRYDKSEYNSDDQNIALGLSKQFETNMLGLRVGYVHNSTISSELLTSGRIADTAIPADQYSVAPNWTYAVNENHMLQLSATYTTQSYDSEAYIGYRDTSGQLNWVYSINDRAKFFVAALSSDYESDDVNLRVPAIPVYLPIGLGGFGTIDPGQLGDQSYATRTKSNGVQVGVDYQWSEQSLIKARFGRSKISTSYTVKDPQQICTALIYPVLVAYNGPIGAACELQDTSGMMLNSEFDWIWSNEHQQFSLNASKNVQPTSNGYAVDSTLLESRWSYQFSERNGISARLSAARNRAIDKENFVKFSTGADRDYGSVTLQYERRLAEYWFLNASYQFSEQKYLQNDSRSNFHVYTLGLSYRPQQWHWAR